MANKKSLLEKMVEKKLDSCGENKNLWFTAKNTIVPAVTNHLTRISSQMPKYDIHDAEHSQEIIRIMGEILSDKLKLLSFYELILLYLAAYLHDSGMALPDWEYETLKIVEECDKYSPSISPAHKLKSDFQSSKKYDIAKKILDHLGFNYEQTKNYIFIEDSEEKVIETILDLIGEYESFRHEEIEKRKNTSSDYEDYEDYKKLSEDIRSEFIRQRHHKKARLNVENLNNRIKTDIGSFTDQFLKDLADICQAHGEDLEFIKKLPENNRIDWEGNDNNNIQFLAEMLRLADIIHFSSDRAPRSLFSEKLITDETSLKHWKAKEDVKCQILQNKDPIEISFHASCSEPGMYYFLADYIKEIEGEISNFDALKKDWKTSKKYNVSLYRKVKNKIICNGFTPDPKLKFTMDQSKILELLMGVQLYQDKFACLREVYQNALDTSKCFLAYNESIGKSEKIDIEFGVGEEVVEGIKRKYIYCRDCGLGMNKEVIKKYLLHIGNSYYKSGDFNAKKVEWGNNVTPTSQFGIGILSCYMIADKIGISTIYYEKQEKTSCVLSGISERFYYIDNMSRTDEEKIGNHGTIVKLYLKNEYAESINSDSIQKMPLFLDCKEVNIALFDSEEKVKNNLFYILFRYVGIQHPKIPVVVNVSGVKERLYQYNRVFNYKNYAGITKDDIEKIVKHTYDNAKEFIDGQMLAPLDVFFKNIDLECENMKNYIVETETDNVTLYTLLSLPKKGSEVIFDAHFIGRKFLCIDGIAVEKPNNIDEYLGFYKNCLSHTLVNFTGERRPILSVNRTKCIESDVKFPDEESNQLKEVFLSKMLEQIETHMRKEEIDLKDKEFFLIWDCVRRAANLSVALKLLMKTLTSAENLLFPDEYLSNLNIKDVDLSKEIKINSVDFRKYKKIPKQLISEKCICSESISVSDDDLIIANSSCSLHEIILSPHYDIPFSFRCVIRADKWKGKYEEYDMVTSLWPIVNPNLFNRITWNSNNNHSKVNCSHIWGDIDQIAELDPSDIYLPDIIKNGRITNFTLKELSNYEENEQDEKNKNTLFVYISPRMLKDSEKASLKDEKTDSTFEGIKKGWSIYFLPEKGYIIRLGIRSREEMENLAREKYDGKTEGITYVNTNGKIVIQAEKGDKE